MAMKRTKAKRKGAHPPNSYTSYHQRALLKARRLKILNKKEKPLPLKSEDTLTESMIPTPTCSKALPEKDGGRVSVRVNGIRVLILYFQDLFILLMFRTF